jgi:ABC-type branched-subunit amino acid transport system permease subunit
MKGFKKMKRSFNYIDFLKITAIEVGLLFLVMFFFDIESVWTLVAGIVLVVAVIIYSKVRKQQFSTFMGFFSSNKPTVLGVLIVLLFLYPLISPLIIRQNTYWLLVLIQTGIYLILALGLNIQLGSTGVLNLAVAAFYGIGGYTAGLLSLRIGAPAIITLPLGGIAAALFGMLLYVPLYKTKGHYLALVTLAFGLMIVLALDNTEFTGGPQGLMAIPELKFFGYSFLEKPGGLHFYTNYYYFVLVFVLLAVIITHRLYNSWVGLTLATIRDDETAAKCCGVNSNIWKMISFITGNIMIGVAGAIYAHMIGFISPPNFSFAESLLIVAMVILGGLDNVVGIIVGTIILSILPEKMRVITEYRIFIYGILLIVIPMLRPGGLLPFKPRKYHSSVAKG